MNTLRATDDSASAGLAAGVATSPKADLTDIDLAAHAPAGGSSCKLDPSGLIAICETDVLRAMRPDGHVDDDAALVEICPGQTLVSSVDLQAAVVGAPSLAGEIAANNALSGIYACGAVPQWAEVILGLPRSLSEQMRVEAGRQVMSGIAAACSRAGCHIVGGHTIVSQTALIGLAVRSVARENQIKRKSGARPGDKIILTKPLGIGLNVSARKAGFLSDPEWAATIDCMRTPNDLGAALGAVPEVTALTDVLGSGLLWQCRELAVQSGVSIRLTWTQLPVLPGAMRSARAKFAPGLAMANWDAVSNDVELQSVPGLWRRDLLCDPQTNGGLLIAVRPDKASAVEALCRAHGLGPRMIGSVEPPRPDGICCIVEEGAP